MVPATIKLFLPLGDAKRLRTADVSNWTGKAVAAPRSDLGVFLQRPEAQTAGIYFLLGVDPLDGKPMAYVGQAGNIAQRVTRPDHKERDFWNSIIAFVSKDGALTEGPRKYLEGLLIDEAKRVGRYKLDNSNGSGASLTEPEENDTEVYFQHLIQLFPILGSDLLTPSDAQDIGNQSPVLTCTSKSATAKGRRSPAGFVVFEGSTAAAANRRSASSWIIELRHNLLQDGTLLAQGDLLCFTRDVEFSSPSAAAAVVFGGNAAGPVVWKDDQGRTLKALEEGAETQT